MRRVAVVPMRRRNRKRALGNELNAPVRDPTRGEHLFGGRAEPVGAPTHRHHLEAMLVVEVHVHRGSDAVAEVVLNRREALGQLAYVVVVDKRYRGDRRHFFLKVLAPELRAREISNQLRARAASRRCERIDLFEQACLHRDAEPSKLLLHGRPSVAKTGRVFEDHDRGALYASQFSTRSPSMWRKSRTFAVTSVRAFTTATAAICPSA
jgi:hypothetical protein